MGIGVALIIIGLIVALLVNWTIGIVLIIVGALLFLIPPVRARRSWY